MNDQPTITETEPVGDVDYAAITAAMQVFRKRMMMSPPYRHVVEEAFEAARAVYADAVDDGLREARDAQRPARPQVVVLCGSTRFYNEFQQANYELTMAGKIVLSVGFYPHAKAEHGHGEGVGHDSQEKVALDELHKRKIDLADEVLVLNVDGYIGESTRSEIAYAHATGKPVSYLEDGQ